MKRPAILAALALLGAAPPATLTIDDAAPGPAFDPADALGAGIDGGNGGAANRLLTPHNVAAMRSAGLTRLTYRLRTELGIEAWHWNPAGTWSDPTTMSGYWTSSDTPGTPISVSWGYNLPRRGDTVDNANNTDFSRLTDGDEASFWKSNPYLDPAFLHDGFAHAQWLWAQFPEMQRIDAIRIAWGTPWAVDYEVQYWSSDNDYGPGAHWITFPHGRVTQGEGGDVTLKLADTPVSARFIRVLLKRGSATAANPASTDWRDKAGFAVREIGIGRLEPDGRFTDLVRHAPSHDGQTFTHVSSTDPWHRASDRDAHLEQPGLDRVFASGLGNGRPIMVPVPVLYGTPEDAAAMLRYLKRRRLPFTQVELGEEPDGQYASADDYAALYLAWVDRLRPEHPGVSFGGPSAQSALSDTWLDSDPERSWNRHFIAALKARNRLADLGFYSFELYPFDEICGDIPAKLVEQDRQMPALMARLDAEGVPRSIPRIITEYGFSAYSGRAMSEMPSALLMANIVAGFLHEGGAASYLFGYGPNEPVNQHLACAGHGNMMLHMADAAGQAGTKMPSYWTARLLTGAWLRPTGPHRLLPVRVTGAPNLGAYAVRRPDGSRALLLLNRDPAAATTLALPGESGPARLWTYGPAQYQWLDDGLNSHPSKSLPPAIVRLPAGPLTLTVPPLSLAVVALPRPERAD